MELELVGHKAIVRTVFLSRITESMREQFHSQMPDKGVRTIYLESNSNAAMILSLVLGCQGGK